MELVIKKCLKCNAEIRILKDCKCNNCGIMCCNEKMKEITANSSDASIEKHKPVVEKIDNSIKVTVNHVMEDEHFIEWICLLTDKKEEYVYFKPNEVATHIFNDVENGIVYSYCNKHGLWKTEI